MTDIINLENDSEDGAERLVNQFNEGAISQDVLIAGIKALANRQVQAAKAQLREETVGLLEEFEGLDYARSYRIRAFAAFGGKGIVVTVDDENLNHTERAFQDAKEGAEYFEEQKRDYYRKLREFQRAKIAKQEAEELDSY